MKFFASLLVFAVSLSAMAAWPLPWMSDGPSRTPQTLIVTGNYKSPRLLAEIIQYESRQPYMLTPAAEGTDTKVYMCMPKTAARELPEEDIPWVIRRLNVRRIVVLGNDAYVQPRFLAKLDREIPVIRIDCTDWNRAAEELGFMLDLGNLPSDYKENREILLNSGKIYRPNSLPKETPAPAKPIVKEPAPVKPAVKADDSKPAKVVEVVNK